MQTPRILKLLLTFGCATAVSLVAADGTDKKPTPADLEFDELVATINLNSSVGITDMADRSVSDRTVTETLKRNSDRAKAFYAKNPTGPKARAAKRLEALSLLRAVDSGLLEEEGRANRVGMSFRNDKQNDIADRFEVAVQMKTSSLRHEVGRTPNPLADAELLADTLLVEFPDYPDVYEIYAGVMRNSSPQEGARLANKILNLPAARFTKDQAQYYLDRQALVGEEFKVEFNAADKTFFNSENEKKPLLFYVWSAQDFASPELFNQIGKLPNRIKVIGVNIDLDVGVANKFIEDHKAPGTQYVDERGLKSPLAQKLRVIDVPAIYVVSQQGILVGFGPPSDLTSLTAKADK